MPPLPTGGGNLSGNISVDEDENNVYFILSDGTTLTVAKRQALSLVVEGAEGTVYFMYGETKQFKVNTSEVEKVTFNKPDEWKVDYADGVLSITAPTAEHSKCAENHGDVTAIYFSSNNQSSMTTVSVAVAFDLAVSNATYSTADVWVSSVLAGDFIYGVVEQEVFDSFASEEEFFASLENPVLAEQPDVERTVRGLSPETAYYLYAFYAEFTNSAMTGYGLCKVAFKTTEAPEPASIYPELYKFENGVFYGYTGYTVGLVNWNPSENVAGIRYVVVMGENATDYYENATLEYLSEMLIPSFIYGEEGEEYYEATNIEQSAYLAEYETPVLVIAAPYDADGNMGELTWVYFVTPEAPTYESYLGDWMACMDEIIFTDTDPGYEYNEENILFIRIEENVAGESYKVYGWSNVETTADVPAIWNYHSSGLLSMTQNKDLASYPDDPTYKVSHNSLFYSPSLDALTIVTNDNLTYAYGDYDSRLGIMSFEFRTFSISGYNDWQSIGWSDSISSYNEEKGTYATVDENARYIFIDDFCYMMKNQIGILNRVPSTNAFPHIVNPKVSSIMKLEVMNATDVTTEPQQLKKTSDIYNVTKKAVRKL